MARSAPSSTDSDSSVSGDGVRTITAEAVSELVGGELRGDPGAVVSGVAPLDRAAASDVSFLAAPRYVGAPPSDRARESCSSAGSSRIPRRPRAPRSSWTSRTTRCSRCCRDCTSPPQRVPGVHPTARLGRGARIGSGVSIEEYVVIGAGAVIGDGVWIGPHAVVGDGARIGKDSVLYAAFHDLLRQRARRAREDPVRRAHRQRRIRLRLPRRRAPDDSARRAVRARERRGRRRQHDDRPRQRGRHGDRRGHEDRQPRADRAQRAHRQAVPDHGAGRHLRVGAHRGRRGVRRAGRARAGTSPSARARASPRGRRDQRHPAGETWSGYPARPHRESLRASGALFKLAGSSRSWSVWPTSRTSR